MEDQAVGIREILADDTVSVHSFETILPAYSEPTVPKYTPPPSAATNQRANRRLQRAEEQQGAESRSLTARVARPTSPPAVPQPQILSISQSNLPLRYSGPQSSKSNSWSPKIVYSSAPTRKTRPGPELNVFFRNNRPPVDPLAHGDTTDVPYRPRHGSLGRNTGARSYEEEVGMRELDLLTRKISRASQLQPEYPKALPQVTGSLRRESALLDDDWDNLAVEAQREEIILRISELESQFEKQQPRPGAIKRSLLEDVTSLQTMLSARKAAIAGSLELHTNRLRELRENGTKLSHAEKDKTKNNMMAMKSEIAFLESKASDLQKLVASRGGEDTRRRVRNDAFKHNRKG